MNKPEFLQVLTADIERVGGDGACALALIRFVTKLDNERGGRVRIDGQIWWRASYAEIGQLLGMDRYAVRRTLTRLEATGSLLCRVGRATDRTKAYRLRGQSLCESATGVSSHYADSQQQDPESFGGVADSQQGCGENATAGVANPQLVPLYEELKEELKEGGSARGSDVARTSVLPSPRSSPFAYLLEPNPPPSHCPRHTGGTDKPCGACGVEAAKQRHWFEMNKPSRIDMKLLKLGLTADDPSLFGHLYDTRRTDGVIDGEVIEGDAS